MKLTRLTYALVLALFLLLFPGFSERVSAAGPESATLPLTSLEQAGLLSGLTSRGLGRGLFPQPVGTIAPKPFIQRDYRPDWLISSPYERTLLAERIGEQGRARFAAERGWNKLIGSRGRTLVQGPDSVYWDPYSGQIRVLESKGGTSALKFTYGSTQGTNTNTIRSAARVLKSARATPAERLAAARVIRAAQKNRLQTGVVRTGHMLGRPDAPQIEGEWSTSRVAREAREWEQRLVRRNPELRAVFREAGTAQVRDMLKYRATQGLAALGLAGAGMLGWDAYRQGQVTWTMLRDPTLQGTVLPYLQTGITFGRLGQSITLGLGSAAQMGLLGQGQLPVLGRAAGRWFLPMAIGVESLLVVRAYYEYSAGRISQRALYQRATGSATFGAFTVGGAVIGAAVGIWISGAGAVPGAAIGAEIGAMIAIPVQSAVSWALTRADRRFNEAQGMAFDAALDRVYGLSH